MSALSDLSKRNAADWTGSMAEEEVAVVESLWERFVDEFAVEEETVPVRVVEYFRGWLTEGGHWGEIPSGLKAEDAEALSDPLISEDRRRELLAQIAAAHRDQLVCTVVLRVLAAAFDQSLRCGDPADAGVESLHRLTSLRGSR